MEILTLPELSLLSAQPNLFDKSSTSNNLQISLPRHMRLKNNLNSKDLWSGQLEIVAQTFIPSLQELCLRSLMKTELLCDISTTYTKIGLIAAELPSYRESEELIIPCHVCQRLVIRITVQALLWYRPIFSIGRNALPFRIRCCSMECFANLKAQDIAEKNINVYY